MERPPIPNDVDVALDDATLERAWQMFHRFEASHHLMDTMNPLDVGDVETVLDSVPEVESARILDLACGHGTLLRRAATHGASGLGIDVSPWQIARAHRLATDEGVANRLRWRIGRAEDPIDDGPWDLVACLGAPWIFDGFRGTVEATVDHVRPGGVVVVGDLQTGDTADQERVAKKFEMVHPTRAQQITTIESLNLEILTEVDPGEDAWDAYQDRMAQSATTYAAMCPSPETKQYLEDLLSWRLENSDFPDYHRWTVWVARKPT